MRVTPEAKPKPNIQLPAGLYAGNLLYGVGSCARSPCVVPSLGHVVWPSVGKGRLGGELVERFGGIAESRCPPFSALPSSRAGPFILLHYLIIDCLGQGESV